MSTLPKLLPLDASSALDSVIPEPSQKFTMSVQEQALAYGHVMIRQYLSAQNTIVSEVIPYTEWAAKPLKPDMESQS